MHNDGMRLYHCVPSTVLIVEMRINIRKQYIFGIASSPHLITAFTRQRNLTIKILDIFQPEEGDGDENFFVKMLTPPVVDFAAPNLSF